MDDRIIRLAESVIAREPKCRPEAAWIQQQVDRLAEAEGIRGRAETDRLIYGKMYGKAPGKTDTVKIRYWRTGRHVPTRRGEAHLFARALGLSQDETVYFLQSCMEKSDYLFERPAGEGDVLAPIYEGRRALMERMLSEYIAQIPPARMIQLNIPYDRLGAHARHLYCMDAISATALGVKGSGHRSMKDHFLSVNYESEFLRMRRLLGEIPRKVMLRHIVLLGMPYLNRRLIDERLRGLGYLPLTEGHTGLKGELLDDLVIGLFGLYGQACAGQDPLMCRQWLSECFCTLDRYLRDSGKEGYRFLYFRSLSAMVGEGDE